MSRRVFLGPKLRQLRRERGLTQVAMAKNLGISASYLNLIEHNRRSITADLADRFASACGIEIEALSGRRETRLREDLQEALSDELFSGYRLRRISFDTLIAAEPQFCRAFLGLYRAYRKGRDELRVLGELLMHNPALIDSHHKLLTTLTSLRSFAEIMRDNIDLTKDKRSEFAGILVEESESLTTQIRNLFQLIGEGGLGPATAVELPHDEVIDILQARSNYFQPLEDHAEAFAIEAGLRDQADPDPGRTISFARLCQAARALADLRVEFLPIGSMPAVDPGAAHGAMPWGAMPLPWHHDRIHRVLALAEHLPEESRSFLLLKAIGEELLAPDLEALVAEAELSTIAATLLYRATLTGYFAAAVLMPYEAFRRAAEDLRYDLEALQHAFGTSFEQVCHRLVTLHRPGLQAVPFHFLRSDVAGNIDKRFSASGLGLPRYGGICPLWNLHGAFLQPGRILVQLAEMPDGGRFILIARTVAKAKARHGEPERIFSIGLGCDASFAHRLVYADGMDLATLRPVQAGVGCRQCPREACGHRARPSTITFTEALTRDDSASALALS